MVSRVGSNHRKEHTIVIHDTGKDNEVPRRRKPLTLLQTSRKVTMGVHFYQRVTVREILVEIPIVADDRMVGKGNVLRHFGAILRILLSRQKDIRNLLLLVREETVYTHSHEEAKIENQEVITERGQENVSFVRSELVLKETDFEI